MMAGWDEDGLESIGREIPRDSIVGIEWELTGKILEIGIRRYGRTAVREVEETN